MFMARENPEELAGFQVPEPERAVARARDGMTPVGADGTAFTSSS